MKTLNSILTGFIFFISIVSYSQEITGTYNGKKDYHNEKLILKSDFTFELEWQFSDMITNHSGVWNVFSDTLILNPKNLPNDSVLSIKKIYDKNINGILLRVKDSDGCRDRFNKVIVYFDSKEYVTTADQHGDYIYNENDYRIDSIAIYLPISKKRVPLEIGKDINLIKITTERALRVDDIYKKSM